MYRSETDCTSCSIVCNLEMLTEAFDRGPRCDNVVGAKDEFEISSRPTRFHIYGKIRKWDGKRQRVYSARIYGIPFLAGIFPY